MLRDQTWVLTGAAGRIATDLHLLDATEAAVAGTDGVLHLGGLADEANFHDLVEVNIAGTFHALDAARRTGVKRFIYASSNRLTGVYPVTATVNPDMPPRPDGLYGVSKIAGEGSGECMPPSPRAR